MSRSLIRQSQAIPEAQCFHSLVSYVAPGCLSGLTKTIEEAHNGSLESLLLGDSSRFFWRGGEVNVTQLNHPSALADPERRCHPLSVRFCLRAKVNARRLYGKNLVI